MISSLNRKKTNIALRMTEDEYIAACSSCSEVVWLQNMLEGLFDEEIDAIDIPFDN